MLNTKGPPNVLPGIGPLCHPSLTLSHCSPRPDPPLTSSNQLLLQIQGGSSPILPSLPGLAPPPWTPTARIPLSQSLPHWTTIALSLLNHLPVFLARTVPAEEQQLPVLQHLLELLSGEITPYRKWVMMFSVLPWMAGSIVEKLTYDLLWMPWAFEFSSQGASWEELAAHPRGTVFGMQHLSINVCPIHLKD